MTEENNKLSAISQEIVVEEVEFIDLKTDQPFDKEILSITDYSILKNNLAKVKKLEKLLQYGKEYLQYTNDANIRTLSSDDNKLKGLIYWINFHDKYNEIEKIHSQYQILQKFLPIWEDFQLNRNDKKINQQLDLLDRICINLNIKHNLGEILNNIRQAQLTESDYSNVLSSIHSSRESLYSSYDKLCNNHKNVVENDKDLQDSNCPFCGYNWNNFELLKKEFEKQTNIIKSLQTDTNSKIQSYVEELKQQLELINLKVNDFINNSSKKDRFHFFTTAQNINYPKEVVDFINGRPKLTELIKKHAINDLSIEYDIAVILDKLKSELSTVLYKPSAEFINLISELDEAYSFIKDSNQLEAYLNEFNNSHIEKKVLWLNNIYNIQKNKQHKELTEKIEKLRITKGYFDKLCNNKLTNKSNTGIIDKLDNEIKEYWKNSIKQIEIPLYYYSGKILQHSFRGTGIFVSYDSNKTKSPLKFLPSHDTDYDAIFSMSSGQLSVVVIALTLAFNLAYGNGKEGGILLIDDPIQSMDDINISALIDLLRHQFTNHQLIFSTHEDEMAMYFNYKFEQLGKKVKLINMKDEHFTLLKENKA